MEDRRLEHIVVIHNVGAGDGSQPPALLRRVFDDAGYDPSYVSSDADWEAALQDDVDLVVVVGGDGTVAKTVRLLGGRQVPVTLLPAGTANNLAKTMGIGGDARDVVRSWRDAAIHPLDVWMAKGPRERAPFVEAVGGGLLATTITRGWELQAPTFILGSEFDRALHLLRTATANEPARAWRITIDGIDHSGDYIGVEVMNGPYVGPNIALAPEARPGDASLDVVLMQDADRAGLLERFRSLPNAMAPAYGALQIIRGRDVDLVAPAGVVLHLDGDAWHRRLSSELAIEIRPAGAAVEVLVPGQDAHGGG